MTKHPEAAPQAGELRQLLGTWKAAVSVWDPSSPAVITGTSAVSFRPGPGENSIVMTVNGEGPQAAYAGMGILGWDANENVYKMLWTDNSEPGLGFSIGKKDGENIVFAGEILKAGMKVKYKDVISDRTPTSLTWSAYLDDGTGEKRTFTLQMRRAERK